MAEGKSFEGPPREEIEPPSEETKQEFLRYARILTRGGEPLPGRSPNDRSKGFSLEQGRLLVIHNTPSDPETRAMVSLSKDLPNRLWQIDLFQIMRDGEVEHHIDVQDLKKSDAPKGESGEEKLLSSLHREETKKREARRMGAAQATEAELKAINDIMKELIEKEKRE